MVSEGLGEGESPELSCEWTEGNSFSCPEIDFFELHVSELDPGIPASMDAALTNKVTLNGTFEATAALSGQLVSAFHCGGNDCASFADEVGSSFPCSIERTFSATYQGE